MNSLSPIAVYCGAAWGAKDAYKIAARRLGAEMAARKIDLVYGGGKLGLMREIADAVLFGGASVAGVITHQLKHKEVAHEGLSELEVVDTMHERKKSMVDRAKAFIAMPGGVGTLDELFEILAWQQLGIHAKPIGLLNTEGFFDGLMDFVRHMAAEGFLRINPEEAVVIESSPERLLDRLASATPVAVAAWATTQPPSPPLR